MVAIISDIIDGIKWLINFFFDKTPKAVQLIIFLLFLLVFGNIIVMLLQIGGLHCNSDKEVIKISPLDVATNIRLFWMNQDESFVGENISVGEVHPYNDVITASGDNDGIGACVYILKLDGDTYRYCDNLSDVGCKYYYRYPECYDCTELDVGWYKPSDSIFSWRYAGDVCGSDARPTNKSLSIYERTIKCTSLCQIPTNYYWDVDDGVFRCDDLNLCGDNVTEQPPTKVDETLLEAEGELLYTTSNKNDYRRAIYIRCSGDYNPRLTFFGIDIFDYKIWLVIFIISMLFLFLNKIKAH